MSGNSVQQYCLRWNNYQNNLTNVFDQLLQSEAFVDVTLACDGNSLKAHKMVLSACSPYFQSLFFENPCTHPIVILKDVKWTELKSIVEFVYRGEINVSQEQLAPLLKVAEALKIRGLADVNRGTSNSSEPPGPSSSGAQLKNGTLGKGQSNSSSQGRQGPVDHDREHLSSPPYHHNQSLRQSFHSSPITSAALGHHLLPASLGRKRRKLSHDERSRSPPTPPDLLDDQSNQLEIDSTNGDYEGSAQSPIGILEPVTMTTPPGGVHPPSHTLVSHGPTSGNSIVSIGSSLIGLQNINGGPSGTNSSSALSNVNELDLKPGIVEMIREEERAKMLESSHGWLGTSAGGPPTLSDSYQYQIQSLWQKCWNTNQGGLHALRFRERGPLKSWRPETMAEAIFAVLREGLSLSQAARKFDIPYPTFVLYANRVHNMLGPSSDGSGANDLLSDMRPKGRGRPQRILLGTWPEDHIRGVIRAVVFRDGGKDELPYAFSRDPSQNGLDMTLHQQLASINPFLALHHGQQMSDLPTPSTRSPTGSTTHDLGTLHIQAHEIIENDSESSRSSTRSKGPEQENHATFSTPFLHSRSSDGPPLTIDLKLPGTKSIEFLPIKTEVSESDDEERNNKETSKSPLPPRRQEADSPPNLNLALEMGSKKGFVSSDPKPTRMPSPKCTTTTITLGKD